MSFKECLSSVSEESGHEAFRSVFDITGTAEGTQRMRDMVDKYPILRGMLDEMIHQCQTDAAVGVDPVALDNISMGFGLAIGTLSLIAESEI